MKKLILSSCILFLFSCGDDDDSDSTDNASSTAWSTASAIIAEDCAASGCHNGTTAPNYTGITEAAFKATNAQARINSTSNPMPPSGSSQADSFTTTDKNNVLKIFE